MGEQQFGIDPSVTSSIAADIAEIRALGVEVGVVIGGGNIFRGVAASAKGMDRVKGAGFSLQFTTAQNIDELANRIKSQGVRLETEPTDMPWGVRVFRVADPDGFKLVFSSERP